MYPESELPSGPLGRPVSDITHVELMGVPGSGKTTLCTDVLRKASTERVVSLDEEVRSLLASYSDDALVRLATRFLPSEKWASAFTRSPEKLAALSEFAAEHADLMSLLHQIVAERSTRIRRPDLTLRWFYDLAAKFEVMRHGQRGHVVLIDEGFANRAISLFAESFQESVDGRRVRDYARHIPRPRVLFWLRVDEEVALARNESRGWSQRFSSASADQRLDFLRGAEAVTTIMAHEAKAQGVEVVELGTGGDQPPVARVFSALAL